MFIMPYIELIIYYLLFGFVLIGSVALILRTVMSDRKLEHPELYDEQGKPLDKTLYVFKPSQSTLKQQLENLYNKEDN